jgi:hypothetical protein
MHGFTLSGCGSWRTTPDISEHKYRFKEVGAGWYQVQAAFAWQYQIDHIHIRRFVVLLKPFTLSLPILVLAAASLFAGPLDEARSHFNGAVVSAYKEMIGLLDQDNVDDGRKAADNFKEWVAKLYELFHVVEASVDGIDATLKSRWADLYRLLKDAQVQAGVVLSEVGKASYKSDLAELKSRWEKFGAEFDRVYDVFVAYGKVTVKFQELCSGCK